MGNILHTSLDADGKIRGKHWKAAHSLMSAQPKTFLFDVEGVSLPPLFGYTTISGADRSISTAGGENHYGCLFTCPITSTVDTITVALKRAANGSDKAKCAIYLHSDLSFIATTAERTIAMTTSYQWFTFTFASPPTLTRGVEYLLAVWADYTAQTISTPRKAGGATQTHQNSVVYNGWNDPFFVNNHMAYELSIYGTFELTYTEILATRAILDNTYIKPSYARIVARVNANVASDTKLKIHDGVQDVAEVVWATTGAQTVVGDWTAYTDTSERTMSVWYERATAETLILYNVGVEFR